MSRSRVRVPRVYGSRATGYHCEGPHFYTWQPDRPDALGWGVELAPLDSPRSLPGLAGREDPRHRSGAGGPSRAGS
jgi:hypothetical protein